MQHHISVERYHPSVPTSANFPGKFPSCRAKSMMEWPTPAHTVCADYARGWGDLLIWLPGVPERHLEGLAHQEPLLINETSADYLENRTWMKWIFEDVEVRIDMWTLNDRFLCGVDRGGFGVALYNDLNGRYASHDLKPKQFDSLVCGLQGAMTNSGPNYHPVRQWGEKFLDKRSGRIDSPRPGVITPTPLTWR